MSVSASEALDRLRKGNARFVANAAADAGHDRRAELVNGQEPFAIGGRVAELVLCEITPRPI